MFIGCLVKPPQKYINGDVYTVGDVIKLTASGSIAGTAPLSVVARGSGGGGGADIDYTQFDSNVENINGERGGPGSLNSADFYSSGETTVTINAKGTTPAGISAVYPNAATASDGTTGGSVVVAGVVSVSGGSLGDGAYMESGGANSSSWNSTPVSVTVSNPDGSNSGRGAYGRPWGFPTAPYDAVGGAVWLTVGKG